MAELTPLLDRMADGQGAFVLLAGEPGVGKTRLAHELAVEAAARGVLAVTGSSNEVQDATPYAPLVEALQAIARTISAEKFGALAGEAAPALAKLLPEVRFPSTDPSSPKQFWTEQERPYFFSQLRAFLERLATAQPLLLVMEDLHWADESTTLLLVQMARWLSEIPAVVLANYRDIELAPDRPFARALETLIRERLAHRLTLRPLTRGGVVLMLRALGGTVPPAAIVDAVYHRTEGNPFFIEEVFKHLEEEGRLFREPGRWRTDPAVADLGVPDSVRLVIERRLQRLHEDTRRVLTQAAVIGRTFSYELLAALRSVETEQLLNAIDEAERTRMIVPAADGRDVRYTFAHALIQETLLSGLSMPRRQQLHVRVARAIEEVHGPALDDHAAELAHQLYAAGSAADASTTVHFLHQIGRRAVAATAYEDGAANFTRALEVSERLEPVDDVRRCEILLALGDAQWRAGRLQACEQATLAAAAIAKDVGSAELLARAASILAQGWGWTASGPLIRLLEDGLDALGEVDSPLKATLLARLARELAVRTSLGGAEVDQTTIARAIALSEQAVAVARRSADGRSLALALESRSLATWSLDSTEQRRAAAEEIIRLGAGAGDWEIVRMGHEQRLAACLELGDVRQAGADADEIERLAAQVAEPMALAAAKLYRVTQALMTGKLDEAERGLRALPGSPGLRPAEGGRLMFAGQIFLLRREQGRSSQLQAAGVANVQLYPALAAGLAAVYVDVGRDDDARRLLEQLAAHDFRDIPSSPLWSFTLALLAEVSAALADSRRASAIRGLLLPHAQRYVVVNWGQGFMGSVAHYLGVLSATMRLWDEAERHFDQALEMNARVGAHPWVAHTQTEYARMLLLRRGPGDRRKAVNLLAQARETAARLAMRRLSERIEAVLRTHRAASAYPDSLTPREVEVLRLIAAGMSSREIGAELVLSTRTVERHITNLYTKIGAHNRAQAAAYALAHHLAQPSVV